MNDIIHAHTWENFRLWTGEEEERKPGRVGKKLGTSKCWTLKEDPLPVEQGGFLPGAQFEHKEFVYMVRLGNISQGARVERDGVLYTVCPAATLFNETDNLVYEFVDSQFWLRPARGQRGRIDV